MYRKLLISALAVAMFADIVALAAEQTQASQADAAECVTDLDPALKKFPIKDLAALPDKTVNEGTILPTPVGMYHNERVVSTIPAVTAFFAANVLPQIPTLDARKTEAFTNSLPISFLRQYGLNEMSLLGPDLTKPDPFLDMPAASVQSPSENEIDQTNVTLQQLSRRMNQLLGADQRSALENLLSGRVITSVSQVEAQMRDILSRFKLTQRIFAPLMSDKKFLQDIQQLLYGNLEQFEHDIKFIDELQARYRKTRDGLDKLAKEGEIIAKMKPQILAGVQDDFTKAQVEKELVRFEQRVTDLTAGLAICDTFINMWQVIKDNHFELMAGITRALYFTVPIIGAQEQLLNALARQERTQKAIETMDRTRDSMILQMNERMKTAVETQHTHQVESIKDDSENLSQLLVGTILVQRAMDEHNKEKVALLEDARKRYNEISEKARQQRQESGLDKP